MASLGKWGALVCAFIAHGCGDDVTGVQPGQSGGATESGSTTATTLSSDSAATQSTTANSASESATSDGPTSSSESESATSDGPTSASATSTSSATDSGDTTSGGTTMSVDPTDGGTTTGVGTTGDSAGDSSSTGMGSSSTGMMVCDPGADETEPNDVETATDALDDATCDNVPEIGQGTLDGVADVDWFQFSENWPASCGQQPNPRVSVAVDNNLEVCAYFDCNINATLVSCEDGASATSPEDGWPGCCAQSSVLVDLNCDSTSDESAQVRLSVTDGPPAACTPYVVTYAVEAYDDD